MRADQVASLYLDMEAHGAPFWLMGGWGIDALLGRQTRDHQDLDVLVEVQNLERFRGRLHDLGFTLKYVWDEEARWIRDERWSSPGEQPTAFVSGADDGREVDTHVIGLGHDGAVTTLWTSPYRVTRDGLDGQGTVGGHTVRCLTADMQRIAHSGYELPPHHAGDMRLLERGLRPG